MNDALKFKNLHVKKPDYLQLINTYPKPERLNKRNEGWLSYFWSR